MKTLTGLSLLLVILLVSLSAYLRLSHSGIGCDNWPACYGLIGNPAESLSVDEGQSHYQQLLNESSKPLAWATPLHRVVASVLGVLVILLTILSFRNKQYRLVSCGLLLVTLFLAVLGIKSGSLHDPAVVMGNLLGGFIMLAMMGWLWFDQGQTHDPEDRTRLPFALTGLAFVLLSLQIALGGFTSANFAATSCRSLPDCHGSWWPGQELMTALDLSRTHEVTATGMAVGGTERIAIHQAHRIGAVLAGFVILLVGILALRVPGAVRSTGNLIIALVLLEFSVGIASVLQGLPIVLAVAHNWLAALLLLSLLKLISLSKSA